LGIRFFERLKQLTEAYLIARETNYFGTGSMCGIWVKSVEFEIVLFLQLKEHWVPHATQGLAFKINIFCPD